MFSFAIACAVAVGGMPNERTDLGSAMAAMKRLTAAANVPTPGDDQETSARRTHLGELVRFVEKFHSQIAIGRYTASELFNFLQVAHDMVNAGSVLAPLAEEKLCWERAGLNLAVAHRHVVKGQVVAGVMPSQSLDQAEGQVARFEKRYRDALAKCVAPANAGR